MRLLVQSYIQYTHLSMENDVPIKFNRLHTLNSIIPLDFTGRQGRISAVFFTMNIRCGWMQGGELTKFTRRSIISLLGGVKLDKEEALAAIKRMTIEEKIAKLSETDVAHIQDCIEQAVTDEQKQVKEKKP